MAPRRSSRRSEEISRSTPPRRLILNREPDGEVFLKRYAYFLRLSVPWYLVKAAPARPVGRRANPAGLPGGDKERSARGAGATTCSEGGNWEFMVRTQLRRLLLPLQRGPTPCR
jgi:hypothetical protein